MITNQKMFESKKIAAQRFLDTKKVTEEEFEKIITYVDHERYYKYLPWIFDVWCKTDKKLDPDEIVSMVKWFDTNLPRITKKDIYQYSFQEMLDLEKELGSSKSKEEKEAKALDSVNVYDDGTTKVLLIKTYKAANMYNGENSSGSRSWCVGRQESTWDSYTEHSTFYFVWHKPKNSAESKYERSAVQVMGNKITVWDKEDSSHTLEQSPFAHLEKYFKFIAPDLRDRLLKLKHKVLPDKTYHFEVSLKLDGKGLKSLRELPIKISIVDGEFDISNNELIDLKGCPQKISSLNISGNKFLKSLEGCPNYIREDLKINDTPLTSLKGCAEKVGGNFTARKNKFTTLIGGPKEVGGDYDASENLLTTTLGLAEKVGKGKKIILDGNKLEYLDIKDPEQRKIASVKKNPLKDYTGFTLEHFVKNNKANYKETDKGLVISSTVVINDDYLIDDLRLMPFKIYECEKNFTYNRKKQLNLTVKNLMGSPEIVGGTFDASSNALESLEGAPKRVNGKFMVSFNNFKTLKGFPEYVGINATLNRCPIESLEGIGQIGEQLFLLNTPVRDLGPLKNNKTHIKVLTDAPFDEYINVPSNVTLVNSNDIEN